MNVFAQQVQAQVGIRLTSTQLAAFEEYERLLLEWNERINLTAIRTTEEIRTKHFLDSLTPILVMRDTPIDKVIDVGTGAGFPGIPLKITCPSIKLTLVESVGKKADFCRIVVESLKLDGVRVIQDRAEVLGQAAGQRERYDWAMARAVANLPVLVEYLLPLLKVGGKMLAMKGESAHAEAHSAEKAFKILGGRLKMVHQVTLPGVADERYLIVIDKIAATPLAYPRRPGTPAKKPLTDN